MEKKTVVIDLRRSKKTREEEKGEGGNLKYRRNFKKFAVRR